MSRFSALSLLEQQPTSVFGRSWPDVMLEKRRSWWRKSSILAMTSRAEDQGRLKLVYCR